MILRIDKKTEAPIYSVLVEFTSKWKDLYEEEGIVLELSYAVLKGSVTTNKSRKKSRLPACIPDLSADFAKPFGLTVISFPESIQSGLRLGLEKLLTLVKAIEFGNLDKVKGYIAENPGLLNDPIDETGDTVLIYAAWQINLKSPST